MAESTILIYERRGDAIWLTLNRPEVRNPLSREMVTAIHTGLTRAAGESGARAIVIAGAGPVFCAGADVKQYRDAADREVVMRDGGLLYDLTEAMTVSRLPIIARVQRAAFGGAIGLLCGADLVVAADDCRFSLSEARLGLVPAVIGTATIRALGHRNARAIMMLSEPFGVEHALKTGLIQDAVAESDLDTVIEHWLSQIRAGAPGALADAKKLLHNVTSPDLSSAEIRSRALEMAGDRRSDPEGQEGMLAFIEKRRPAWNPE
jgi:methylglutaconyl-CoA hydratase